MNPLVLVIVVCIALAGGYVLYGRWLAHRMGVDFHRETPARTCEGDTDYALAAPYTVFGHHFSSIAGVGVIAGPILAAEFGWLPVVLWIVVGGILIGATHDFGALFVSLRSKGALLVATVRDTIDVTTKRLFCLFAYLVLVLMIAAFISFVASTFQVSAAQDFALNHLNARVALVSALFVAAAVVWGVVTRVCTLSPVVAIGAGAAGVIAIVAVGLCAGDLLSFDGTMWMLLLGIYVFVAAVVPMWVLLQPRDFLSALLLFGIIGMALVGIIGSGIAGTIGTLDIPLWSGFFATSDAFDAQTGQLFLDEAGKPIPNPAAQGGFLFPALFVTVSCGAISGFHSLVSSGTTSKQLSSERYALPVGFGGMLCVCLLAIVALCAVGFVWNDYAAGAYASPVQVFADGISSIFALVPGFQGAKDAAYTLCALALSVLCLTTLDTATRLARSVFQEFWMPAAGGLSALMREDVNVGASNTEVFDDTASVVYERAGMRALLRTLLANKYVATFITVVLGVGLGTNGYALVWPLFGVANLLLAACALLAVSAWFARAGKRFIALRLLRALILIVAVCSLVITIVQNSMGLLLGEDIVTCVVQLVIACALLLFAFVIADKGRKVVLLYEDYCE